MNKQMHRVTTFNSKWIWRKSHVLSQWIKELKFLQYETFSLRTTLKGKEAKSPDGCAFHLCLLLFLSFPKLAVDFCPDTKRYHRNHMGERDISQPSSQ